MAKIQNLTWRGSTMESACVCFFLTKAKPKSPECSGEEGSPLAGAPLGCQDDSSQLCHIVAWVILSSTDSIPASRPGSGRTRVTSWMCLALLAADFFFFFFSFCFLLLFFLSKDCSVVWSFPSLLPAYLASATWTFQLFLKCRSHPALHKNLVLLGGKNRSQTSFSLPSFALPQELGKKQT